MSAPLWTPTDLAARWSRPVAWVRRAAAAGTIPAVRIGGLWRFDPTDIERYEARHRSADPLSMTPGSAKRQAARR